MVIPPLNGSVDLSEGGAISYGKQFIFGDFGRNCLPYKCLAETIRSKYLSSLKRPRSSPSFDGVARFHLVSYFRLFPVSLSGY